MAIGDLRARLVGLSEAEQWRLLARFGVFPVCGGDGTDDDGNDDAGADDDDADDADDAGKAGSSKGRTYSESEFQSAFKKRLARERRKLVEELTPGIRTQLEDQLKLDKAKADGDLQKIIDDLTPKAGRLKDVEAELGLFHDLANARFEEALDQLPDAIRAFAPDEDASPVEKERWLLTKAMPALRKLNKRRGKASENGDADETDDDDDDRDDDRNGHRSRARDVVRGNNPWQPLPGGKSEKKKAEDIIRGYKQSGTYRPM